MNNNIAYVEKWLADDETIMSYVDDVRWDAESWSHVSLVEPGAGTPSQWGSLVLTNRRLIVILRDNSAISLGKKEGIPCWYSVTSIASLTERPPGWGRPEWPYRAKLTLYSGVVLNLETLKDRIDERGKELSRLLVKAFTQLDSTPKAGALFAEHVEDEKRRSSD